MTRAADIVLINPGDKRQVYQDLGAEICAVEPPYWSAILAQYLRERKLAAEVIDAPAENLSPEEIAARACDLRPRLALVMVYGYHPSASTQNMTSAGRICRLLQDAGLRTAMGGLHPTALPLRTLQEEAVDYVITGEGFDTLAVLAGVLRQDSGDLRVVPGLWYRAADGALLHNPAAPLEPNLDRLWTRAAWDLLPMERYRAHNWHCLRDLSSRGPYAALYTSLGCPYRCEFCCINALFGRAGIRYRSPAQVLAEMDELVHRYGVRHLKISDELFVFTERHYRPILDGLIERNYGLNIWAYARVNTIRPDTLERMKRAGINWLALGIESGAQAVLDAAGKKMTLAGIEATVRAIQDAGIAVMGNYLFGLPEDTQASMQQTLELAQRLNCEYANFYCAMAYPGSRLYEEALREQWPLPATWHGFSQHAYETCPLPTRHVSAREVLAFRDRAFHAYFENPDYLARIENLFGAAAREHVQAVTRHRLRRQLLESV